MPCEAGCSVVLNGVNLSGLDEQFAIQDCGKTLLLDGDFLLYQAAATVKTVPTAVRRLHTLILTEMFMVGCKRCEVFFTDSNSSKCLRYMYPTVLPYQGNRKGKAKPPLLEPLKQRVQGMSYTEHPDGIEMDWAFEEEADDRMIARSIELGSNCIVSSGDKDLRLTPAPYWEAKTASVHYITDRFGDIWWTGEGSTPVKGHGSKFFWTQMLMGDTADNVRGIARYNGKLCGPRGAFEALAEFTDESECANHVVAAYAKINQDVLAEAQCLWLRRSTDDSGFKYLMEVVTIPSLRDWLQQLHDYHIALLRLKQDQVDETY